MQYKQIKDIRFFEMQNSHIVEEDQMYARFDLEGKTKLVRSYEVETSAPTYSYRRVHYTHEGEWVTNHQNTGEVFSDPQYQIDKQELSGLDSNCPKIILKRLYSLYMQCPTNQRPQFFPPKDKKNTFKIKDYSSLPPFSTEIGILPIEHYKSLFLTQEFTKHGLYEVIINQNGRFETDVVDDWVPVYEETQEPIWGMDINSAWQVILLKFWAKKNKGYSQVKRISPFRFIQFFTNSNWKYFNLHKEGTRFLETYHGKTNIGRFVIKTKDTYEVSSSGLIPNSAGYEIIDLDEKTGKEKFEDQEYVILVRSTLINKWAGSMSVLDEQMKTRYEPSKYKMKLQRDFMMNQKDFLNMFSVAFIASKHEKTNYYSDYYILQIPANQKNSIYIKFRVEREGWFDFCIKQFDNDRVPQTTEKSRMRAENGSTAHDNDGNRYLKVKYILVKDNETGQGRISYKSSPEYATPRYDIYDIEYLHGYNRGDARFEEIVPGDYYFRIKVEKHDSPIRFVINYACNSKIEMTEVKPTKAETSMILREAMASLIGRRRVGTLDKKCNYEEIAFSNMSEEVGYSFIGARLKKTCPYRLLIEIDPIQVKNSGYKLKNQFKNCSAPFSLVVAPGECTSIVLNKISPNAEWPPKGVEIFKEK